ncbi:Ribosomal protein S18 acetylase RimI [Halogranum amylolyticum]|uniref:Ribosomal protein S18 acetylase RimI n=1 Tax=Halogranum amylolyticum TaxID=660520 RepID=A0A1H8R199_9EURY|nr:GNAT family N-acetyltransferase [Halogranum amylolyticum]SEO60047.1 Ribosomal protein S18 acetylase RimI [Halogranum amylolyticum]
MEIRPATASDIEGIQRVARRSWSETYADLLDADVIEETVGEWYDDESLQNACDKPGVTLLVAVDDEVVGFCHGVLNEDEGDVLRLYVDPDRWHEGIGRRLLDRVRSDLEDFNMRRMRAMALADNAVGDEFYREYGFEKTGEGEVELGGKRYAENVYTQEFATG